MRVVIAAPDPFHPALAVAALEAGLHVMCEKPLALTLAGCDAIAAAPSAPSASSRSPI